jgi:dUTP pyrophosphatase
MMNEVKVSSFEQILKPAHAGDAGFDVVAFSNPKIVGKQQLGYYFSSVDYIEYDTNLVVAPPEGFHCFVFPRSSLSKTNLVLANHVGTIDNGYRGTIKLRFKYIPQPQDLNVQNGNILMEVNTDKIYAKGDKIGQIIFAQTLVPELIESNEFEETTRNMGGFGSTGL